MNRNSCDLKVASVLDIERYAADLQRQFLRRIGYTNGLHKIRRFARVVQYLYPIMPTSAALLAQIIIREENLREENKERPLKGTRYATGIIDVCGALGLLERFGRKIALSSEGYACHALSELHAGAAAIDGFLLERIIDADGEYFLNILRIVSEGITDVVAVGSELIHRFTEAIRYKQQWVTEHVPTRYAQKVIQELLSDSIRTLEKATASSDARLIDFFFKHTVNPRIEWLQDLGCLNETEGVTSVTQKGAALLAEIRELGGWADFGVFLPLNSWLSTQLAIPSMYEGSKADGFSWRLVAASSGVVSQSDLPRRNREVLLRRIKEIYPAVKLANFNEADAASIYHVLAALEAIKALALSESEFYDVLTTLVEEFPSDIFKLSKRRGHGLYIALKK